MLKLSKTKKKNSRDCLIVEVVQKEMENYQRSVRHIHRIFKYCGQDIFSAHYKRRGIIAYAIILQWIFWEISYVLTAMDTEHYSASIRFQAASFIFGSIQVVIDIWTKLFEI